MTSTPPYRKLIDQPLLVTGASGFVGEHLAHRLVPISSVVVAAYHRHKVAIPQARTVSIDLTDRPSVQQLVEEVKPAAVFHCAAATNVAQCQQDPSEARRHIVDATINLAQTLSDRSPATTLVSLSTDLVFDGRDPPYDPHSTPNPLSVYGQLKLEAEAPVLALPHGTVLRTSLVYGPATTHKQSFLGWIIDHFEKNQPLPLFIDEVRTPIFVEDLAQAMIAVAGDDDLTGLWHAAGPQRLDRAAMGRQICATWGFDEQLVQPSRLADSTYPAPRPRDVSLEAGKLWDRLQMRPRRFDQGLAQIAHYRANRP